MKQNESYQRIYQNDIDFKWRHSKIFIAELEQIYQATLGFLLLILNMCFVDVNHDLDEVCLSCNYFVMKYKVLFAHNKRCKNRDRKK